jgi:hypothetical protein
MPNGCLKLKLKTRNFKPDDIMEDDSYDMDLGVAPRTAIFELNFPHAPCFGKWGERGAFLAVRPRPRRTEFLLYHSSSNLSIGKMNKNHI